MPTATPDQKTMLIAECLHAAVVVVIMSIGLVAYLVTPGQPTLGLLGSVTGGGLIYAHARASAVRGYMRRNGHETSSQQLD